MDKIATLHIGGWSSRCGVCGKSCNPSSKTHDVLLGYGEENGTPGCGVEWTHVASDYAGTDIEKRVQEMRPDLIFHGTNTND